jgi:tetratricopeptide (TPR) repeat protein
MRTIISLLFFLSFAGIAAADVDALRSDANAAATAGDTDKAIALFTEIIEQAPDDGAAHYRLGSMLMDNGGDLDDAAAHFERAGELEFQAVGVAFRLSRIYAQTGRESDALDQLEIMANNGFGLPNLIEGQDDYASIRDDPRYAAALETIQAARFPCDSDEKHHAFDFWIGEWDVSQSGQAAGTNNIQSILGHCVIFEQWEGLSGTLGKSFNYYDPGYDHWRQIWVSDSGTVIEFTGQARDGGIFYTAETIDPADGAVTHHKFEFTQNDDGSVRQFWATSTDAKETWTTSWDGHYEKPTR